MTGEAAIIRDAIEAENSVAVFVRRGDYVKFKGVQALMGDTNLTYYRDSFSYIVKRVKDPHFFVFSDDIAWCRENITFPFNITYVGNELAGPKFSFQLQSMSLCKHAIGANSTFSWWGAWLNRNPEKIVIAPKRWYADGRSGEGDIVPESWIKL